MSYTNSTFVTKVPNPYPEALIVQCLWLTDFFPVLPSLPSPIVRHSMEASTSEPRSCISLWWGKNLGFNSLPAAQIFSWRVNWQVPGCVRFLILPEKVITDSILMQHSFIVSLPCRSGILGRLSWVQGITKLKRRYGPAGLLSKGFGRENPLSSSFRC